MANFSKKMGGKEVGDAKVYATPHNMAGDKVDINNYGVKPKMPRKADWVPLAGVSIGNNNEVKTTGIKTRGNGAAIKGITARGPMA
jgi:hypothetical protein